MRIVIGPVLIRERGYAFDCWTSKQGLQRGYTYPCVEDAHYARKFDIRCRVKAASDRVVACDTVDEFVQLTGAHLSGAASRMRYTWSKNILPMVEQYERYT